MGRLPATDVSGQVGLRRNLAELEPAEGPMKRPERERELAGVVGLRVGQRLRVTGLQACTMDLSPAVICKTHEAYSHQILTLPSQNEWHQLPE